LHHRHVSASGAWLCCSVSGGRPRAVTELAGLCGFDAAIAAEDLELLGRRGLAQRDRDGVWSICCPALAPSVERLVRLVLKGP
jgi:hypothetical protein